MAGEKDAGSIVYTVSADIEPLLQGGKQAVDALGKLDSAAQQSGKGMDSLDQSTSQTGAAFTELAGYANSMDNQLKKLNSNVSGIAKAMAEARSGTGGASNEFSRAESIIEALGNQLAVLDEAQENGARSAAVLAAQLRAGSKATDEEKQKIGELTGRLFDMKTSVDAGSKGHGNWKSSMQQAGYQVQDFIIQVQGGQSALVAFSQQGSQLAGAFGPGGAIVGSIIALGSVLAGVLITSLNGGKNAMDALKDAAETMDKVITISQNGVAALSDKYAMLAKTNAEAATILRNQAIIEYNAAVSKIPKAIGDAAASVIDFGDKALSAFSGGYSSINGFSDRLASLNITTDDYTEAMKQAYGAGQAFQATASSIGNTVGSVASKFAISEQAAFKLVKQMDEVQRTKSTEALQRLVIELQNTKSSSDSGTNAIIELLKPLTELVSAAGMAKINLAGMNVEMDNLTAGQKNLIKQSERNLALSKLQGEARARLQAEYAAEDAGFAKDDPHAKRMEDDAAATYKNTQAQKTLQSEQKKGESQAERNAKVLEEYRQKAELSADSTANLSREHAILAARQKLTNPSPQQIAQVERDAALAWDKAAAIKAQAAAEKLLPEARENASYKQDVEDLNTALVAKKISQDQYNETAERLEQQHQTNLAKIRAQAVVSPTQQAKGEIDPVQQLANKHAQQLALIQQFETQKGQITQRGLELMNAANTQYEQARIAAQWEIWRNQSMANEAAAAAFDSFAGNASNALTGIITRSMSASDALRSIGSNALNSLINSFVQMGVEWAKSAIMGSTTQQAAIAATTSAQVAGIGVQTAASTTAAAATTAAWTPAAIMSSIASFGGAVAIGLGAVAAITALSGKRKNGGPVSAGGMYQVGEGGMPEIYQASTGKQYMIPGDNGKVISNKDITSGSGGGAPILNIYNYSSASVDTQATQNGDGSWTLEAFIADMNNGGPASGAITSNMNVKRTPRGQS